MLKRTVLIFIFFISLNAFAKDISKKYGLVFIYDTKCPYCQKMAPTVVDIHKEYGFSLYAISPSRQVFGVMEHETNGQVSLNKDIAQKYYGSNPVRFPLLILQELDGEMKHYVIADGLTPKNQVEKVLNSYLNYFKSTNESIETEHQKDNSMKRLTQEQIDKLSKSLKRIKHYSLESEITMSKEQWDKVIEAMKDTNKALAKLEQKLVKIAKDTPKLVKSGDTND